MASPRRCSADEARLLAAALADTPETIFARQRLSRGLCPAYLIGEPTHYAGALVEALPGQLLAFGEDPQAIWKLIQLVPGWTSVTVQSPHTHALGAAIAAGTDRALEHHVTIIYVLPTPVAPVPNPMIRLMEPHEADIVMRGPGGPVGAAYGSPQALLAEGYVAGAVVGGELVARAHTSCQSPLYADVAVATAPDWRGKGLASAAASLVCARVQESGRTPVWSTTLDNLASQRIAQMLGFEVYGHVIAITLAEARYGD